MARGLFTSLMGGSAEIMTYSSCRTDLLVIQLREIVEEACDSITIDVLRDLIDLKPATCQAFIDAEATQSIKIWM